MATPMIDTHDFISRVQRTWVQWMNALETLDTLDCEETAQSFSIILPNHKIYLFNQHTGLQQLWMSSPISGGRHFVCRTHGSSVDPEDTACTQKDGMFFNWVDTRNHKIIESYLNEEFKKYWNIDLHLDHRHAVPHAKTALLQ